MSPEHQSIAALAIVGLTVAAMVYAKFFRKKRSNGCGCASDTCTAVSPDLKRLQSKLKN